MVILSQLLYSELPTRSQVLSDEQVHAHRKKLKNTAINKMIYSSDNNDCYTPLNSASEISGPGSA